jgi:hypothetical protein
MSRMGNEMQSDNAPAPMGVGLPLLRLREAEIDAIAQRLAERIYIDLGLHSVYAYKKVIGEWLRKFQIT